MAVITKRTTKLTWQEIAQDMQKHRDETIAEVQPSIPDVPRELPRNVTLIPAELLSTREIELTETSPEKLVAALAEGDLTSVELTNAFLRRAGLAQKLVNCITELLPERALTRAKELDDYYAEYKKPIGALHGLPISVKEHVGMKGLDLNAGFVSWVGRTTEDDATILRILWGEGCVFYARTTQPQTLMHLETSSNLYGVTVNPFNRELTSGGSSGGEGALIGLRGSCLGVGTDIGGSIRSPAANNGLYGFRPTSYRLPIGGYAATMLGEEQIVSVIGPLSASLEGIKLFMKTIIGAKPWLMEPSVLPFPWREGEYCLLKEDEKRLKIGVLWNDEIVKPHPPVQRALREVVDQLKTIKGVEIVDWKSYKHDLAWEIIASLYFCDGAQQEIDAIEASGEPWRPLSEFIIKDNPFVKSLTVTEVWEWTQKRDDYRTEYMELWNDTATCIGANGDLEGAVDVILCPVGPGAALPIDHSRYWGYTSQWNLLDYPAVVFPVTKVDPDVDVKDENYLPMNEKDEYNYKLYEPSRYQDAPVSLQLVGRRYEDEKVLEALEFIKNRIGLPFVKT
ncbi:MAG: hypothetical protein M1835_006801 [Candelina submexicana]|nr:MAG: hypothetical protein M1835_006801 [Candelina submexicana]